MAQIKKVLVANRGEIAVRVFAACREMGIATVAVFSEADEHAMHVAFADEAVCIGEPEAAKSYLDIQRVLDAARETGADAIHPGYGFLSERPEFAEACESAGVIFIGPPASAMRKLGEKIDAKQLAVASGVPITPGFFEPGAEPDQLKKEADRIGYPIMLKASAGGGGRGMRIVRDPDQFDRECRMAMDEAQKSFGNSAMMVEKLVEKPRHIEVQILADRHGNVACLFERECSLQRRHQKVLEEAPSPIMTEQLWAEMQASCRKLILAAGYVGAGTVEFMYDEASGEYYFLEVNARLQVEHPVTELITGLDLVRWQIRIAEGAKLDLPAGLMTGDRSVIGGHSIEVRLIAEDPAKGFLPSTGKLLRVVAPTSPGVRFDVGYRTGDTVSQYYDSLLGKLIVHGATRAEAVDRLRTAMLDTHIIGVHTNLNYLLSVIDNKEFQAGNMDTGFLAREIGDWAPNEEVPAYLADLVQQGRETSAVGQVAVAGSVSTAWGVNDGFRNARP
ncbi:MAG: ATP-grasp domain-containing protein [Fimbriimonadaceae bacterium]|nr:MAG: ATP-grasp domain-containing protein [Fimbriimonadaceae bacterium]